MGDLLTEVAIILPPLSPRLGYGVGVRAVWPTAGLNEAGQGKYQIGPVVGVRSSLPEISAGSFFLPLAIYQNSIASRNQNKGRPDINQLNIQPKFNVNLPSEWFLTPFASENIQINYADDDKLFVPFDLMVGKKLCEKFVVSWSTAPAVPRQRRRALPMAAGRSHRILLLIDELPSETEMK